MTTTPVHTITDEQIAELEARASKATPGPWGWDDSYVCTVRIEDGTSYVQCWDPVADALLSKNANYIAAANPATILALLAERAELKRDAARYQFLRESGKFSPSAFGGWALNCGYTRTQPSLLDAAVDEAMTDKR